MNIHKRTRLTLLDRQEIWRLFQARTWKVGASGGTFPGFKADNLRSAEAGKAAGVCPPQQHEPPFQNDPVWPKTVGQGRAGHPRATKTGGQTL